MKAVLAILLSVFRIVVLPVQFQDTEFSYEPDALQSMLDKASLYLNGQFRGTKTFEFTLASPVTLKHNTSWYGTNSPNLASGHDMHFDEAVAEACRASDEEIDFSIFDNDGDGVIDCIAILTAGLSESDGAGDDKIWPQQGFLSGTQSSFQIDGKKADPFIAFTELKSEYGLNPRLNGIGDICHELLHILGLPDFYDTDGETGGLSPGLWKSTALMDSGNRNDNGQTPPNLNAIEMELLGLGKCDTVKTGQYSLSPIGKDGHYLKLLTPHEGEYFLLECRDSDGWDSHIGGEGLLVYHIDRSQPDYSILWETNRINAEASRQGAYILAAEPEAGDVSEVFFPRPGKNVITSDTSPSLSLHGGGASSRAITGIRKTASGISFTVSEPILIKEINAFQDAAIVNWTFGKEILDRSCKITWYEGSEELGSAEISGTDTFTIEHLKPQTKYDIKLTVNTKSGYTSSVSSSFNTKTYRSDIKPYIYLRSADRDPEGYFSRGTRIPLRIFNIIDADRIEWTFDSLPVTPGLDGFFTIEKSGRLKAMVFHSDGSIDIIIKDISVK